MFKFVIANQHDDRRHQRNGQCGQQGVQGDEIQEKQDRLGVAVVKLEKDKKNKEKVLAENEAEKKILEEEQKALANKIKTSNT